MRTRGKARRGGERSEEDRRLGLGWAGLISGYRGALSLGGLGGSVRVWGKGDSRSPKPPSRFREPSGWT